MDEFKIEHFEAIHGNGSFPAHDHLDDSECRKIRLGLSKKLELESSDDNLELVAELVRSQSLRFEVNAASDRFYLEDALRSFNISAGEFVLVNWYRFDNIDRFRSADLFQHFHDIWYPSADDIDVFDLSLSWIVSVDHEGTVAGVEIPS